MTNKERQLDLYLTLIAEQLDITETMYNKAVSSYTAVGNWLGTENNSNIKIFPQGSFNLGTVIKPLSDKDEYDIDLVCLQEDVPKDDYSRIKNRVGDRLKSNTKYRNMLEKEGRRCWTLNYDEFHMDILPCVPFSFKYDDHNRYTKIILTHKTDNNSYEARYSNPEEYKKWFFNQMSDNRSIILKEYSAINKLDIDKVPDYKIKSTLQRAIQILKRHRDIMYENSNSKDNAPISIIITTLAAKAYNNENSLYDALLNIINNMGKYIDIKNGKYYIYNPAMKEENFADKWNDANNEKANEFFKWLKAAKNDIITSPLNSTGMVNFAIQLKQSFGKNIVERAFEKNAKEMKTARENGQLYISGLNEGLSYKKESNSTKVGDHIFYGK